MFFSLSVSPPPPTFFQSFLVCNPMHCCTHFVMYLHLRWFTSCCSLSNVDYQYQVWKWGVIFTDNVSHSVSCVLIVISVLGEADISSYLCAIQLLNQFLMCSLWSLGIQWNLLEVAVLCQTLLYRCDQIIIYQTLLYRCDQLSCYWSRPKLMLLSDSVLCLIGI